MTEKVASFEIAAIRAGHSPRRDRPARRRATDEAPRSLRRLQRLSPTCLERAIGGASDGSVHIVAGRSKRHKHLR